LGLVDCKGSFFFHLDGKGHWHWLKGKQGSF
jgi:hypothetical protein